MLTALAANTWPARFTSAGLRWCAKTSPFPRGFRPLSLLLAVCLLYSCDPESSGDSAPPKVWHVTTLAGIGSTGVTDGIGIAASFTGPISIAQSPDTLYVISGDSGALRTINKNTAEVKTIVTGSLIGGYRDGNGSVARIQGPWSIAIHGDKLYVADTQNHRIRAVAIGATAAATMVSTLAGNGTAGHANGATAQFNYPTGVAVSPDGKMLYVADSTNHRIRAIDIRSKAVSDIAGSTQGSNDGVGTAAQFNQPANIAVSPDGKMLYVTDKNNHRIRTVVIASKRVSTLAGSTQGTNDGVGVTAQFHTSVGIAVSPDGKMLYVTDTNNHRIRTVVIASKRVNTLAGSTGGNKDGIGTAAQFNFPMGISVSQDGNTLYVADRFNNNIRKLEYK